MSKPLEAAVKRLEAEGYFSPSELCVLLESEHFCRPGVPVPSCVADWLVGQNFVCSATSAWKEHGHNTDLRVLGNCNNNANNNHNDHNCGTRNNDSNHNVIMVSINTGDVASDVLAHAMTISAYSPDYVGKCKLICAMHL